VALLSQPGGTKPALILVNPEAGGGRTGRAVPRVEAYLRSQNFPAEFVQPENAAALEERAKRAIAEGRPLLVAMGGDGTVQALANAASGTDVLLGIIPAGGGNDVAAALGIPAEPVAAASALVRGVPRPFDLLRARTADGRERFYCGGGGVGLDAEAAQHASGAFRRWPGGLRYVAPALWALRKFTPVDVEAVIGGDAVQRVRARVLLATVTNTPTYGAGLRFVPDATTDDGLLDLFFVEELSLLQILELLPQLFGSGDLRIAQIRRYRARRVRLETSRPCLFHGDGEIFGPTPVEIEAVRHAVRVIAPLRTPE
jgi:diacylglycerol kinase (ATP)